MTLLMVFGALVMKVNWGDNPPALAVMLAASALAAAALGTMLGTFVKTEAQASGLSIMLGMVMALLGGCWYPIELFPQVVRNIVDDPADHLGHAGYARYPPARAGRGGDIARGGCSASASRWCSFVIGILRFKYE